MSIQESTKPSRYKIGDVLRLDPHFFNLTPNEYFEIIAIKLIATTNIGSIYRYDLCNLNLQTLLTGVPESVLDSMMILEPGYKASIAFDQELFDLLEEQASLTDLSAIIDDEDTEK